MTTLLMVELQQGYGDGYGTVQAASDGAPVVEPGRKVTYYYDDGGKRTSRLIEKWKREIFAQPSVALFEGVRVPASAVKRVIGPLDCPEACRVRMRRFTANWSDRGFVGMATDDGGVAAMQRDDFEATYAACTALRARYA